MWHASWTTGSKSKTQSSAIYFPSEGAAVSGAAPGAWLTITTVVVEAGPFTESSTPLHLKPQPSPLRHPQPQQRHCSGTASEQGIAPRLSTQRHQPQYCTQVFMRPHLHLQAFWRMQQQVNWCCHAHSEQQVLSFSSFLVQQEEMSRHKQFANISQNVGFCRHLHVLAISPMQQVHEQPAPRQSGKVQKRASPQAQQPRQQYVSPQSLARRFGSASTVTSASLAKTFVAPTPEPPRATWLSGT